MVNEKCNGCQYFIQHYGLSGRRLFRVNCGHCTFARTKRIRPDAAACTHFVPAPAGTEAFVSKEYLSKELLQYMLSLELLPEIEDGG